MCVLDGLRTHRLGILDKVVWISLRHIHFVCTYIIFYSPDPLLPFPTTTDLWWWYVFHLWAISSWNDLFNEKLKFFFPSSETIGNFIAVNILLTNDMASGRAMRSTSKGTVALLNTKVLNTVYWILIWYTVILFNVVDRNVKVVSEIFSLWPFWEFNLIVVIFNNSVRNIQ